MPIQIQLGAKLAKGERGAIYGQGYNFGIAGTLEVTPIRDGDEDVLRTAILFADRVDWPVNRVFNIADVDPLGLIGFAVMDRSYIDLSGSVNPESLRSIIFNLFNEHDVHEPSRWTIWHGASDCPIPDSATAPNLAFQLEIQNALVVPHREVPTEDVLKFKRENYSQLISLRHHLEELCRKISQSAGDPRATLLETERLDRAISDYLAEARKPNWRKSVASLKVSMNWLGPASFLGSAFYAGLPLSAATIGGGAVAALNITSERGLLRQRDPSPFAYLAAIERDFS